MIYNIDNQNVLAFSTERGFVDKDMPYDGFNITYYTDDDAEHAGFKLDTKENFLG